MRHKEGTACPLGSDRRPGVLRTARAATGRQGQPCCRGVPPLVISVESCERIIRLSEPWSAWACCSCRSRRHDAPDLEARGTRDDGHHGHAPRHQKPHKGHSQCRVNARPTASRESPCDECRIVRRRSSYYRHGGICIRGCASSRRRGRLAAGAVWVARHPLPTSPRGGGAGCCRLTPFDSSPREGEGKVGKGGGRLA